MNRSSENNSTVNGRNGRRRVSRFSACANGWARMDGECGSDWRCTLMFGDPSNFLAIELDRFPVGSDENCRSAAERQSVRVVDLDALTRHQLDRKGPVRFLPT